jgi:hypothetical protein
MGLEPIIPMVYTGPAAFGMLSAPVSRVAITPGCQIGYMDPSRVVITPGCQIGYMDHSRVVITPGCQIGYMEQYRLSSPCFNCKIT